MMNWKPLWLLVMLSSTGCGATHTPLPVIPPVVPVVEPPCRVSLPTYSPEGETVEDHFKAGDEVAFDLAAQVRACNAP